MGLRHRTFSNSLGRDQKGAEDVEQHNLYKSSSRLNGDGVAKFDEQMAFSNRKKKAFEQPMMMSI